MYFVQDLDRVREYAWGAALLAYTYRALYTRTHVDSSSTFRTYMLRPFDSGNHGQRILPLALVFSILLDGSCNGGSGSISMLGVLVEQRLI